MCLRTGYLKSSINLRHDFLFRNSSCEPLLKKHSAVLELISSLFQHAFVYNGQICALLKLIYLAEVWKLCLAFWNNTPANRERPSAAVTTAATSPSPPTSYSREKKHCRDEPWRRCGVYLHKKYCLPDHRRNDNNDTVSLLPSLLSLTSLPLGCFAWTHTSGLLPGFLLLFACPLRGFSRGRLEHHEEGRPSQLNSRELSVQSTTNAQRWMCQLWPSAPTPPFCDSHLYWDSRCSPFLPFGSGTALQNRFSPKEGDFPQWLGLRVRLWKVNAF